MIELIAPNGARIRVGDEADAANLCEWRGFTRAPIVPRVLKRTPPVADVAAPKKKVSKKTAKKTGDTE